MVRSKQHYTILLAALMAVLSTGPAAAQWLTGYEAAEARQAEPAYPAWPVAAPASSGNPAAQDKTKIPVNLTADSLQHDEQAQTVTASGHVEMIQGKRILKADEVIYNLRTDEGVARGNVVLTDKNGDVHFADEIQLGQEMRSGLVRGLQSYLVDGGHLVARDGTRENGLLTLHDASYTPCECDTDKDGTPAWQLKAKKVVYNEEEHKITYRNAQFDMFGVPVAWFPYISHPDNKIKRKSGFLTPDLGYDSQLGGVLTSNYYWNIAPDRDATTGVMVTTNMAPVALAEYRQQFDNADIKTSGSVTRSKRTDDVNGQEVRKDSEWRGHMFANGRWDINEKWRAGTNLELTSDDQYLRQYDFSSKNVLENELYTERFSGRNYAVGRILSFQDVRILEDRTDQPDVLPEMEASFMGEPNALLGGRWNADASILGLERSGSGQDMQRMIASAGWQKRQVMNIGVVNMVDLNTRGDFYNVHDLDPAALNPDDDTTDTATRLYPRAHVMSSYPLVRPGEKTQTVIEPVVSLTVSPDSGLNDDEIPNEDSQDAQVNAMNVMNPSRFPGMDRVEGGSHVAYGVRSGVYGYGGNFISAFLGQSYRLGDDNNPFPEGSGLSRRTSDVVGQLSALYGDSYGMDYSFQLNSADLSPQRHEFDGFASWNRLRLDTRYFFAKGLQGTTIDENREQVENGLSYDMTDKWRVRTGALHDLGENPGLRKAIVGLDYFGCCLSLSTTAERQLTTDSSGDSSTKVMLRLGLKGLGEFEKRNDRNERFPSDFD